MTRNADFTRRMTWLSVGAASVLAVACESRPPTAPADDPGAPLRITAVTVGTPISTLVVEVTAADLPSTLVFNLTVENGVATGTIRVPPGPARTIHVSAVDNQGTLTHDGNVIIDVRPGANPPVEVLLRPRAGQIPITVTFGNYTVLVTPAEVTIDATVTSQVQLIVTVIDVDGQEIAAPEVGWATTRPTIAVVDKDGLVTGVADGGATIVATFEGVAGLSVVTVTGHTGEPLDQFAGMWILEPRPSVACETKLGTTPIEVTHVSTTAGNGVLFVVANLAGDYLSGPVEIQVAIEPGTAAFKGSRPFHTDLSNGGFVDGTLGLEGAFSSPDSFDATVDWTMSGKVWTIVFGLLDFTCPASRTVTKGTRS